MAHAGESSSGGGSAPESNWPLSLDQPATEELYRFGLLVPPGYRRAKPWRINKDGYSTQGDPTTAEELRTHRGGRYNIRDCHAFSDGRNYNAVIAQLRPRRRAAVPPPPAEAPPIPVEFDLPPEKVVLREDGDPDGTAGLLVALRASRATAAAAAAEGAARVEAEIAAAIQAAVALAEADPQPVVGDDDDDDLARHFRQQRLGGRGGWRGVVYVDESD
ncbi:hypothetical protein ZWY2020_058121 [Hordeum vulgare]|nr:hypothetical protein ZWY2020_058121 [Hordeum vulgare]